MGFSRRPFFSFSLLVVGVLFIGCNKASDLSDSSTSRAPAVSEVRLGYFANVTHAQAVLGVATGDFQNAIAPATLTPKVFNAGPSLIEALFSGEIDIGYIGPGPVITAWWRSHGHEITVVAGSAANGVVIVAGPKSGIHSLAELAGKKIATPQRDNTQDISARHYVLDVLHQEDDRNVVPIANPEQVGRMLAGDIDAAWSPEPWGSRLVAEAGGTIIGQEKDLWPDHQFSLTVVIVRQEFLRQHPDIVRKILAVHRDWTRKLAADPQKYADQLDAALLGLTKSKLPADVMQSALSHVTFTLDPMKPTFATMAQWSAELNVIKESVSLDGLIDTSILQGLQR
jgi:NitT/TauT family transport system substrate-binding protein